MHFKVSRDLIESALSRIHAAVERKASLPILSTVHCSVDGNILSLFGMDLEVGVRISLPVSNPSGNAGSVALSIRNFWEIVHALPHGENLEFQLKPNHWVSIQCGEYRYNIFGSAGESYPLTSGVPSFQNRKYHAFRAPILAKMIDRVLFAVPSESSLYQIQGIHFEELPHGPVRMTSTDLYRLSSIEAELFQSSPGLSRAILLPKKGLLELRKTLDGRECHAEMAFDRGFCLIQMKSGDDFHTQIFLRLLEGEYVEFRKILPDSGSGYFSAATVDRELLLGALKRVSLLSDERGRGVKMGFQKEALILSCSSPDIGEANARLKIELSGQELEIGFNSKYFMDYLNSTDCGAIEIRLRDPSSPVILNDAGAKNHSVILMPMRTS